MKSPDAVVVGAGAIGLACAWRLAQRDLSVCVVDPDPGCGASRVAAGMLAPVTEVHFGEEPLLALNLESARRYPSFVAELEGEAGRSVGYIACGTLAVAADADDHAALGQLYDFQRRLGLDVERLTSRECRRLEPSLSPTVRGGLRVGQDHQVDPRRLVEALIAAGSAAGVQVVRRRVVEIAIGPDDRVEAVHLDDGTEVAAGCVVLASGAWSGQVAGLPPGAVPPVRPVKGQLLRLHSHSGPALLRGNVRGLVAGSGVYMVPRADGEVVVGATMEEQGYDTMVTAGAVHDLLRDAYALVPGVTELELAEASAGLRPCTPDNAPVIGLAPVEGLVLAVGHFRNGILLTPVTADIVGDIITGGSVPELARAFGADRFLLAS
ncbi:MAG TPA: glycine oxidase ThiO [Acidimicrobiales bacterium]|nr:glycine oxidase ThiO [Acidimicrobiales bacterium]